MKAQRYKEGDKSDKEVIEFTYKVDGVEKILKINGHRDLSTDSLVFRCSVEFADDVISLINGLNKDS
jgi:hypothetical protein